MTIFQDRNEQPTIPKEVQIAQQIRSANSRTLMMLKHGVQQAFDLVWKAPDTQAVLDQFGTDAFTLFQASSEAQALIKSLDPSWEELVPPKKFTINGDGTITLDKD